MLKKKNLITEILRRGLWGSSIVEAKTIIDRLKYKGRGRPRKDDYINLEEAQRRLNKWRNVQSNDSNTKDTQTS